MVQPLSPLRLPVRTKSGQHLGIVVDVTIDPGTQTVVVYHVKPSRLIPDVVRSPLLIHRSQVDDVSADGVVVDDGTIAAAQSTPATQPTN